MSHALTAITIALAFAVTMALITIIQARKEGYRKMTALASIYDLLEGVADRIERNGNRARANELRAGFARGTGGADMDYLVEQLSDEDDRASIVSYLRDQIKRHGILGQIAEEIEQRKDREHKRC